MGSGGTPSGVTTKSTRRTHEDINDVEPSAASSPRMDLSEYDQADRIISTGKLRGSPHFHIRPINVVVYHDPQRSLVLRLVSRLDAFSGYLFHT